MAKLGLALGAGGARGLVHIHVLKALDELGIKPTMITGTSIGAIMGAAYASGMSGMEIEAHVMEKFRHGLAPLTDAMRITASDFTQFFKDGGPRIGELNLERLLRNFLPSQIPHTFEELEIPLKVVATDYYGEKATAFDSGELMPCVAASAAIPAVFLPVQIGGASYIDGGTMNPLPFDHLPLDAELIVGIDVAGGTFGKSDKRPGKIDAIYSATQLMQKSIIDQMAKSHKIDLLVRPEVEEIRVLDFLKTRQILSDTAGLKDSFKRDMAGILDGV